MMYYLDSLGFIPFYTKCYGDKGIGSFLLFGTYGTGGDSGAYT